jgi:hypothetical protein
LQVADANLPVVIHCGSGPQPGRFTGPGPIRTLLQRHPGLPLVIAHMGMPAYLEFMDIADRFEQVRLGHHDGFHAVCRGRRCRSRATNWLGYEDSATGSCSAATSPTSRTPRPMRGVLYYNAAQMFSL